ncbi:Protein kinase 4 (Fragment) [Seminavis robusta]|uniref:Protein kinase 4 n=1 Tax=Seminavis robusta TaxID=568900 RepID=A0A9N8ELN5_9STRA
MSSEEEDPSKPSFSCHPSRFPYTAAGELANVYLVSHKTSKKTYALKIFDKLHCFEHTAGFDAVKSLNREAEVLRLIQSPFILQMYQSWQDKTCVYFLLPLIPGGELSKRLYDYTNQEGNSTDVGLPTDHALFYSACIAEAIAHMHQRNIAYRDLKPDNIMIDREGYCVLIDLGFTKVIMDKSYTMCGTPGYVASEQLASGNRGGGVRRHHTKLVDWWSFAVVLYELLKNQTPFQCPGMDDWDTQDAIMIADYKCPGFFPAAAKDLIDKLIVVDVTKRLGYAAEPGTSNHAAILQHEWFETIDFDKLRAKELSAPWIPPLQDDKDTSHFYEFDEKEEEYLPYRSLSATEQKEFEKFEFKETT